MTRRDEIDSEIRNQAVRLYSQCVALFELPRMVYTKIITDNSLRKNPYRVSEDRIKRVINTMPEFQQNKDLAKVKYRCKECFEADCYTDEGMLTTGRVEIACGSMWERDDETDIIGAGVHLDNMETMEWLEIPEEVLKKYFEPVN